MWGLKGVLRCGEGEGDHGMSLVGLPAAVLERPSISSTVGDEGVRQPAKWRARPRVRPREPGKLWLVLSCIDTIAGDAPPLLLSLNQQQSFQQAACFFLISRRGPLSYA